MLGEIIKWGTDLHDLMLKMRRVGLGATNEIGAPVQGKCLCLQAPWWEELNVKVAEARNPSGGSWGRATM